MIADRKSMQYLGVEPAVVNSAIHERSAWRHHSSSVCCAIMSIRRTVRCHRSPGDKDDEGDDNCDDDDKNGDDNGPFGLFSALAVVAYEAETAVIISAR